MNLGILAIILYNFVLGIFTDGSAVEKCHVITLTTGIKAVLKRFETVPLTIPRGDCLKLLMTSLEENSWESQRTLMESLKAEQRTNENLQMESFWISNQIILHEADPHLLQKLSRLQEVSHISEERKPTRSDRGQSHMSTPPNCGNNGSGWLWGVEKINAPQAWKMGFNGSGVVVGTIDTGVEGSHEALEGNFIRNFGWLDPRNRTPSPYPVDEDGHGTQIMGTILGTTNGIGIAPGSKWMSCLACPRRDYCRLRLLLRCLQFMLCPKSSSGTPDCSKAPHVINNYWLRLKENFPPWLKLFHDQGIVMVFSVGDRGSNCDTLMHPSESELVIGVGATTSDDDVATFSSSGPGRFMGMDNTKLFKPDLVAPGVQIFSSTIGARDNYDGCLHGTTSAAAHVTGVVALMLSKNPSLRFPEILKILTDSAQLVIISGARNYGGVEDTECPNYTSGHGRLNALRALNKVPFDNFHK